MNIQLSLFQSWQIGHLYSHEYKHHQNLHGDGANSYALQCWMPSMATNKYQHQNHVNLGEKQQFTMIFTNGSEFIENKIVIYIKINIKLVLIQ